MAAVAATQKALDPAQQSIGTLKIENTDKRDTLIASEKMYQQEWAENKVFEMDAPSLKEVPFHQIAPAELRKKFPKYMVTMAYPYVNGTPHAGHSFTASKLEFAVGWARMKGMRALYPQGYHCTGMPIKACADKLVREIEMFGQEFERCPLDEVAPGSENKKLEANGSPPPPAPTQATTKEDVTKFTTKKSKAAAKVNVNLKYQFQIMLALGIPVEEIHRFADPQYWLEYFPPLWKRDLTDLGCRVDWRRSMVTTDANPYYDAFVRWQMTRLKEMGKIRFGKRYTVYSPKDGQACMDHDRQTGEGIGVQEYTAMKLRVLDWAPEAKKKVEGKVPEGGNVYFVPATLRPETMYGQNCCFVGPGLTYGIYEVEKGKEYYFISERAARNMAFQSIFPQWGVFPKVAELTGADVVGTLVHAPLSVHKDGVRVLPMDSVKATKGSGVVTSVPSDSPDDYATTIDLRKKADFYKIKKEWAELEILPIIHTPAYGDLTAKYLVESMKINSPKDAKQLTEAKELAYKEGFYKGTMIYGDFKGNSVEEAKPLVRQKLIDDGYAFNYAEPDGLVISRSGDECVAGHLDQWFMNYGTPERSGDDSWQPTVLNHVRNEDGKGLNTFSTEVKNAFEQVLFWLAQWACARSYGLGTRLPWDPSQLVESLSDSTIYMSYYTFAHLLHTDIFGTQRGAANVGPEQMTDDVWDYLFCNTETIPDTTISKESLHMMRREFEYWYPLDCRVSGKDLIQNHLTFFLYVHIALFKPEYWPRAVRVNGHLMLNGEKMSKSTGNFLTLRDAVAKFGADATRIALADAGDGIEDANFEETVANSNILRMYELRQWCESVIQDARLLKDGESYAEVREKERHKNNDAIQRTGEKGFWDELFENELHTLVKETYEQYELTSYKAATKSGLYDFISARDFYREATKAAGIGMHQDLVKKYVELQALMITVVAPHWSEHVWLEVLKKPDTVQNAIFPDPETLPVKPELTAAREYVRSTSSAITSAEGAQLKRMQKGKQTSYDPKKEKKLSIFCARKYPAWQDGIIDIVRENFADMKLDVGAVSKSIPKAETKRAMPFVQQLKKSLETGIEPSTVFERKLAFDEVQVLGEMVPGLKQTIQKCAVVEVIAIEEGGKEGKVVAGTQGVKVGEERKDLAPAAENAVPGQPTFFFENV
jgi:leucyl-tRNA synthetase